MINQSVPAQESPRPVDPGLARLLMPRPATFGWRDAADSPS
jgi:hypothetical protein